MPAVTKRYGRGNKKNASLLPRQ
eukprot:SAG31_NODE_25222_length_468_cov_3.346995_1_plen_22_part_10